MLKKKVVSQCISSDYCKGWNDAVKQIVHCNECKYYAAELDERDGCIVESNIGTCNVFEDYLVGMWDFCSFGKRKTE